MTGIVSSRAGIVLLLAGAAGCGEVPQTLYGDPSGLHSSNLPGEAGIAPLTCDGGGEGGRMKVDAGCPSWMTDIYPNMQPTGAWQCSSAACHGGNKTPPIDPTDPSKAYMSLQPYVIAGQGNPYINTGSADPTKSTIVCNLSAVCGNGMPQAPGKPLTCVELDMISAWIRCGAANN